MARAFGSYPKCRWFKSNCRYQEHIQNCSGVPFCMCSAPAQPSRKRGPLVKRLRHRPFTAVTGVRFSYGSPNKGGGMMCLFRCPFRKIRLGTASQPVLGGIAQLVEHSLHTRGVGGSSPSVSTKNCPKSSIPSGFSVLLYVYLACEITRLKKQRGLASVSPLWLPCPTGLIACFRL